MQLLITPRPLCGAVAAIPSKSYAHRLLIAAALSTPCAESPDGARFVKYSEGSEDISATCRALRALSARIEELPGAGARVTPIDRAHLPDHPTLDCGESGTTLRHLLPIVAALGCGAVFTGRGRLPRRPLEPLAGELKRLGIELESLGADILPLRLSGKLSACDAALPGNVSSQFIGGLLIALTLTPGTSAFAVTERLESASYVRMTLEVLEACGAAPEESLTQEGLPLWRITGRSRLNAPAELAVEGDWSNAAFWLCAGALSDNGGVTVTGLNPKSLQGDRAALDILRELGASVTVDAAGVHVRPGEGGLAGATIDVSQIPDALPILAVTAAAASGVTRFTNAARLRIKESDRLATTSRLLSAMSVKNEELPDGLVVHGLGDPRKLSGKLPARVDGANDHRIVMAAAVAGAAGARPMTIDGGEAFAKSYPEFPRDFRALGGLIESK